MADPVVGSCDVERRGDEEPEADDREDGTKGNCAGRSSTDEEEVQEEDDDEDDSASVPRRIDQLGAEEAWGRALRAHVGNMKAVANPTLWKSLPSREVYTRFETYPATLW